MYDISSINVLVLKICIHHLYYSLIRRPLLITTSY